jgi:U32 family peptidase
MTTRFSLFREKDRMRVGMRDTNINNKIELLAPAGDWDAFRAAVENGADAVYMGGKLFNARQFAGNFDNDQLKQATDYAHIRGAKVYLTMNTLLSDGELEQAVDFAGEAYLLGIDGIIVQDIGFAGAVRKLLPELELHASTQMTVYNLEGVRLLEHLGFKRVVLARELSLEEIANIAKNTALEIEVFIHGALCISYSGQCLMSSIIGGRSGNRGKCAQPCRLKYELVESREEGVGRREERGESRREKKITRQEMSGRNGFQHLSSPSSLLSTPSSPSSPSSSYLLSPKDLCGIDELQALVDSGVSSLKIEGRMKTPEYVAIVVGTYRKYLDRILQENRSYKTAPEDMKNLTQVFNRGGFSRGYLRGKTGRDMMSWEKPKNWGIYLGEVIDYDRAAGNVKLKLSEGLSMGDGVEVWTGEEESPGARVSEIRIDGKPVRSASENEIVLIGSINGRITKGNKVYKTSDSRLNTTARESFERNLTRKTKLEAGITIKASQPVILEIRDTAGNTATVTGSVIPEPAINRPITRERIVEQLEKTGATPFAFEKIETVLDGSLSVPVSEINNLRRQALELLESKRASHDRQLPDVLGEAKKRLLTPMVKEKGRRDSSGIALYFYQWREDIEGCISGVDRVYVPFAALIHEERLQAALRCRNSGVEVYAALPAITRGNYDMLIRSKLEKILASGIDGMLVGNPGSLEYVRKLPLSRVMGDYALNVFNSRSAHELAELQFDGSAGLLEGVTLSPELTLHQIADIGDIPDFTKEAIVYGRIPVMTSEYCPVGSKAGGMTAEAGCTKVCSAKTYRLKDRMGMEFPVLCDRIDCRSTILNTNVIFIPDALERLKNAGVNRIRLMISDEGTDEIRELVELHKDGLRYGSEGLGKHKRLAERIKERGFTKGHYFRGV